MSIINWAFYAGSHCKDKTYGSAAIISTNLLFVLTLITIAGSLITFVMLSNRNGGGGRVSHQEERTSLVPTNNESAVEPEPEKPKPKPV